MSQSRRVLVTGAAGFVGSNLVDDLLSRGHAVIGIDDMSFGHPSNIRASLESNSFDFHTGDVLDDQALPSLIRKSDTVVHLAARKIPRYGGALDTLLENADGIRRVGHLCAESGVALIFASTSDVYGRNPEIPFSEESDSVIGSPFVKRWAYAVSKMFGEHILTALSEERGLRATILRLFGSYGPNQHMSWWGGPQAVFIENALQGRALTVHGDGRQTRSFTYVKDHANAIANLCELSWNTQLLNLGTTDEIEIRQLATLIWELVNPETEPLIEWVPYETFGRYEDVRRRVPDSTRAASQAGFQQTVSLRDGLIATIKWQRERTNSDDPS